MVVEPIIAPSRTPFTIPEDEVPLTCVLRRVVGPRTEEYLPRLARVWNTPDVESPARRANGTTSPRKGPGGTGEGTTRGAGKETSRSSGSSQLTTNRSVLRGFSMD